MVYSAGNRGRVSSPGVAATARPAAGLAYPLSRRRHFRLGRPPPRRSRRCVCAGSAAIANMALETCVGNQRDEGALPGGHILLAAALRALAAVLGMSHDHPPRPRLRLNNLFASRIMP